MEEILIVPADVNIWKYSGKEPFKNKLFQQFFASYFIKLWPQLPAFFQMFFRGLIHVFISTYF